MAEESEDEEGDQWLGTLNASQHFGWKKKRL